MFNQLADPTNSLPVGHDGSGSITKFGDPFLLPSWSIMPQDIRNLFDVCRFLYLRTPSFAEVGKRVISYFLTDVEFVGSKAGDKQEQEDLRDWLREQVALWIHQMELGMDQNCFGTGFSRIHRPFSRFLMIPTDNGYIERSVSDFPEVKYLNDQVKYSIDDPTRSHRSAKHRRTIQVSFLDRVKRDINRISLQRIDPAYAHIQLSDRSGRVQVVERFQPHFEAAIKRGDLWQVNETPINQLEAISKGHDFLYNEGEVFIMKAPHISGISNGGWGVPPILGVYPHIHQMAVYKRIDEAIGMDYMYPFRVFFPNAQTGGNLDAHASSGSMQVWKAMLGQMISDHRLDPTSIHAMPFQMGFQEVGGEGKKYAPKESIDWQQASMLNDMGYPAELYSGSMAFQQIPTALRLFENHWQFLPWSFNKHLQWVTHTMQDFMGYERMNVKAMPPQLIGDIDQRNVLIQLAAGGEFPRQTAFRPFGVRDAVEAAVQRAREDAEIKKQVTKVQEDAALEMGQGSFAQSGGAGGAPAGTAYTPAQMGEQALAEAQRLLQIPFDGDRQKELAVIKQSNPDMHALVKQKMSELRSSARSQGGQNVAQLAAA